MAAETKIANLSKELYDSHAFMNHPELFGDLDDDLFRPAIADELKIGHFSLDKSCQTEQSDILKLKDMTNSLQGLLKDSSVIQRDISLTRKKLETEYEKKLQEKTFELYSRINNKLKELETMHHERVGIVRKAYRQQLADALARVETLFQARFEEKMEKDRVKHREKVQGLEAQISNLTQTVQRNESVIVMLRQQLASKMKVEEPPPREDTTKIDALTKQMEGMKEQIRAKDRELGSMEDELDMKTNEINQINDRYNKVQQELDKELILKGQIEQELAEMRNSAAKSSEETRKLKQMAADLEKQRQDLELEAEERARKAREEAMGHSEQKIRGMQSEFAQKIAEMMKDKENLEKQLLKNEYILANVQEEMSECYHERENLIHKAQDQQDLIEEKEKNVPAPPKTEEEPTDTAKLIKSEREMRIQMEKYKAEIKRLNRAWEKKFAVLQASLHALKDESYLRQHLEKQHTTLHQATISYMPDQAARRNTKKHQVLPGIPNRAPSPDPLASYSVSRASNRNALEHQIDSADEDDEYINFGMSLPDPRQGYSPPKIGAV